MTSEVRNPKTKITAVLDANGNVEKLLSKSKNSDWQGNKSVHEKAKVNMIEQKSTIDFTTGEFVEDSLVKESSMKINKEPNFIKLYLSDLVKLKDLPKGHEQLLFQLFGLVGYNNVVGITAHIKKMISENIGLKPRTIDKYLSNLVDCEILFRAGLGTYVFNPNLVAKGEWKDIRKLRLSIEYNIDVNGNVVNKTIQSENAGTEEVAITNDEIVQAPKRRGRPKGSKNKVKKNNNICD